MNRPDEKFRTQFLKLWPYRLINVARAGIYEGLVVAAAAVVAVAWALSSDETDISVLADLGEDRTNMELLSGWVAQAYPAAVAFLVFVIVLRIGRVEAPTAASRHRAFIAAGPPSVATVVSIVVVLALLVVFLPGPLSARLGPVLVGAFSGWLVRRVWFGRAPARVPTAAGFKPPRRATVRRRDRQALRSLMSASGDALLEVFEQVHMRFAERGDESGAAWCVNWTVDALIGAGDLDGTDRLIRAQTELDDRLPALVAARCQYEIALGSTEAEAAAKIERSCARAAVRPPRRVSLLSAPPARGWRRGLRRVQLVWAQQYATVLRELLEVTRSPDGGTLRSRMVVAIDVAFIAERLGTKSMYSAMTPLQAVEVAVIDGMAGERCGELMLERGLWADAAALFAESAARYTRAGNRPGAGRASVRAALASLASGERSAEQESHALGVLKFGLEALEHDRGRLRERDDRKRLLDTHDEVYDQTLHVLCQYVRHDRAQAAELAAWLLESTHRNQMADRLRKSGEHGLDRYREPVDLRVIKARLGGRIGLLYRCRRHGVHWRITTVMIAEGTAVLVERQLLRSPDEIAFDWDAPRPEAAEPEELAKRVDGLPTPTAAGILDRLSAANSDFVATAYSRTRLDGEPWRVLGDAVLPPQVRFAIDREAEAGVPVLAIVPDGPLARLPFAGLPNVEGAVLVERAAIALLPHLMLLPTSIEHTRSAPPSTRQIVANLGPTRFTKELVRTLAGRPHPQLQTTDSLGAFRELLAARGEECVAVIANHGQTGSEPADRYVHLNDGTTLTARDALDGPWPRAVVLTGCWTSDVTIEGGRDPLGLATACLHGGAEAVVGGQAPVADAIATSRILAAATIAIAAGADPVFAVRTAVLGEFARSPRLSSGRPQQWANLAVWSSNPPPVGAPAVRPMTLQSETPVDLSELGPFLPEAVLRSLPCEAHSLPTGLRPRHVSPGGNAPPSGPLPSARVLSLCEAAVVRDERVLLTSARFVGALAAASDADWATLVAAGIPIVAADEAGDPEDFYGGEEISLLGDRVSSPAFHAAYERASALAEVVGVREVEAVDVLWGLFGPLGPHELLDDSAQSVLSQIGRDRWGDTVPSPEEMVEATPQREWFEGRWLIPVMLGVFVGVQTGRCLRKTVQVSLGVGILALISFSVQLHAVGTAPTTADLLRVIGPRLRAEAVLPDGTKQPAILYGSLAEYVSPPHVSPFLKGLITQVRGPERDANGVFVFVTQRPEGASSAGRVELRRGGKSYRGELVCPGEMGLRLCVVVAKTDEDDDLVDALDWKPYTVSVAGPSDGGFLPEFGVTLGAGAATQRVRLKAEPTPEPGQHDALLRAVSRDGSATIPRGVPVLVTGSSNQPPTYGLTLDGPARESRIYPSDRITSYLRTVANRSVHDWPEATAHAGIALETTAAGVAATPCFGGPADTDGLLAGDMVRSVDGSPVASGSDVVEAIRRRRPGDRLAFDVTGPNGDRTVSVMLTFKPLGRCLGAARPPAMPDRRLRQSKMRAQRSPVTEGWTPLGITSAAVPS